MGSGSFTAEALFDVAVNGFFQSFSLHPLEGKTHSSSTNFSIRGGNFYIALISMQRRTCLVVSVVCCPLPTSQAFVRALAGNCYFIFPTIVNTLSVRIFSSCFRAFASSKIAISSRAVLVIFLLASLYIEAAYFRWLSSFYKFAAKVAFSRRLSRACSLTKRPPAEPLYPVYSSVFWALPRVKKIQFILIEPEVIIIVYAELVFACLELFQPSTHIFCTLWALIVR